MQDVKPTVEIDPETKLFLLELNVGNFDPKDVVVHAKNNTITVQAVHKHTGEQTKACEVLNVNYSCPDGLNADYLQHSIQNGTLTITGYFKKNISSSKNCQ